MGKKIFIAGSANADLRIETARMPLLGETVPGSNFSTNAGGKGLNQAIAVAKLGGNAEFLGVVGQDAHGDMLLTALKENGAAFAGERAAQAHTGIAMVNVVGSDNFIILSPGANDAFTPELADKKAELIKSAACVVLQLEIPTETVLHICRIAHEAGARVVLNPAPFKELPAEIFPLVDVLVPNEHEVHSLTGIPADSPEGCRRAIACLRSMGVKTVIITLGEKGCAYNIGEEVFFRPAKKVQPVDTTSAGDTFIGALCVRLCEGDELPRAIEFATAASAITVTRTGAARSIPFASEVQV